MQLATNATPTAIEGRKWTARIEFSRGRAKTIVHAERSDGARTMRDTGDLAVAEAVRILRLGAVTTPDDPYTPNEARVYLDKTTKAHGTAEDRQYAYVYVDDGKVLIDRW